MIEAGQHVGQSPSIAELGILLILIHIPRNMESSSLLEIRLAVDIGWNARSHCANPSSETRQRGHVCVHADPHAPIKTRIWVRTHTHMCVNTYIYIYTHACMYVFIFVCMHACMHACMYICVSIYAYMCTYINK